MIHAGLGGHYVSDDWYYDLDGGQVGPLSLGELRQELAKLSRRKQVFVWRAGFTDWKLAGDVPEITAQNSAPPPLRRKRRRLNREIATLVVAIAGVALFVWLGLDDPKPSGQIANPSKPNPLPTQQVEFCSIVENATATYRDLSRQWTVANEQKNGIVKQQLSTEMTKVYRTRNQDVFRAVQQTKFAFDNWTVVIAEISYPDKTKLRFTLQPLCSPMTKVHAALPATPENLDLLSKKKTGDRLVITGRFVERFGGQANATPGNPVSAEEFEGSFTESGAMQEPEYSAVITQLN
jgi:hypothetical protein